MLRCAESLTNTDVARELKLSLPTVGKWRSGFWNGDWKGCWMNLGPGLSPSAVSRIWRAFALQPQRTESFKLSTDPQFIEQTRDVVGLYLAPPDRAIVLSVDETSQILPSTAVSPDATGTGVSQTSHTRLFPPRHDHLFAAWNVVTWEVLAHCLARHPRFMLHLTPTGASWLKQVEQCFAQITTDRIRRGVFRSVPPRKQVFSDDMGHHHASPRPFVWTATDDEILGKVARPEERMNNSRH